MLRRALPALGVVLSLTACGGSPPSRAASRADGIVSVTGAGATFPYPIYSKWFDEYHRRRPDVQINYQSIGSGGGIRQIIEGTVDFGATDGPMTDEQLARSAVRILHFPTVIGAVVPTFNVAGVAGDLRFTPSTLAGIFLGSITRWNHPAIASHNPGVALPDADIVVVHRSDGSGTTYIWTDYLSKVDERWAAKVGRNTSVNWPVGLGGKGNEGVAGLVKATPNSIGYLELVYALQNRLPFGAVQNAAGTFVKADLASVTAAAAAFSDEMPEDFRVSITNPRAPDAYPVASFTWLLVPEHIEDGRRGQAIVQFLKWMLLEGQAMAAPLSYAPLPPAVVAREQQLIGRIRTGS